MKRILLGTCLIILSFSAALLPSTAQPLPLSSNERFTRLRTQMPPQLESHDQQLFERLMSEAEIEQMREKPLMDRLEFFALKLLGQPYQAGLLDQIPTEELFLSLTQFDCVLYVEAVLALAHSARLTQDEGQGVSAAFAQQVENLRYRDGIRDGYCSRLHYFSEWLDNNQAHGYVKNISLDLGGIPLNKRLQFMSRHRSSYPSLQSPETYNCIRQMEDRLATLPMHYVPTAAIDQIETQLQPGDIIAVATSIPHLDVTHTGLIYQEQNGRKGLIHASPGSSVRVARNLTHYVSHVNHAIGIMVARPIGAD